jgi:NADPH:quinone reductase
MDQSTMRAIVMRSTGGPEVLKVEELPVPTAGTGEVLVRTEASGISFAETRMRSGAFLPMVPSALPARVGTEAVGVVIAVGDGVDPRLLGTRVLVTNGNGTHAEHFTAAAHAVTQVPDGMNPVDVVAVAVQGATALSLLWSAALSGKETVLIEVGGGGVGGYLVQMAHEFGADRVVATAGSEPKRARARELGADQVVDHRRQDWTDHVRDAIGEATFDVIFESIGGSSAGRLLDAVTTGTGRVVFYGQLDGPAEIKPFDLMIRSLTLIGCGSSPADYRAGKRPPGGWLVKMDRARGEILQRLAEGLLRPLVDSVMPLADAAAAHHRIEDREAIGKVVLMP